MEKVIVESNLHSFISKNFREYVSQLSSLINIPSVSVERIHKKDVHDCANWLANHLKKTGMDNAHLIPATKHPIVYAEWLHAVNKPTVLIYGHYDVQPADPLSEWESNPFSGAKKNGYIYGRGSSDDKGQLFAHVKAIEYFLTQFGKLPVNVKCVFEGEEEIGSPGLKDFIQKSPAFLKADTVVISDMSIPAIDEPGITISLRGALSFELTLKGQNTDLHSGTFGGAIDNAAYGLCKIISKIQDDYGRITIPGFYNGITNKDSPGNYYQQPASLSNRKILMNAGYNCGSRENDHSLYERIVSKPSFSVNGIKTGYQGEGPKAIIPSVASAKISFRLVAGQNPDNIEVLFRNYINKICPPCFKIKIEKHTSAKPVVINTDNIFFKAAGNAYKKGFGKYPLLIGSGGTIPIVNLFQEYLQIPMVLMGFALPDDNPHGPNEKFLLSNFYKGITTSITFLQQLGNIYNK